jgi:hypothetical protein
VSVGWAISSLGNSPLVHLVVREQINLQFRAEASNLSNREQFRQPNTVRRSNSYASFGVISSQLNLPR